MRKMLVIAAVCIVGGGAYSESTVTTAILLDEMINLERLTRFPAPSYKTIQFSSYDRRSVLPGEENWFSNSDGSGVEAVIKEPDGSTPGEYILCDVEGPGAIVRTWTAQIDGTIRVYLDESDTPIYDGPAVDFLQRPYDAYLKDSGLTSADLRGTFYQREAAYAPMPFSRRCKVVWLGNQADVHFYHIQFRMFDAGTVVTPFTTGDVAANADRIRNVIGVLADPAQRWTYHSSVELPVTATVTAGNTAEGLTLDGAGAVERLTLKVSAADIDLALRQTILRIQFDGHPWGQVEAPIGDFFGAGPGIVPFDSLPFTVTADGTMTSRYVMPFGKWMRLTFENRGGQDVRVSGYALRTEYAWDANTSMHFRARWRVDHGLTSSNRPTLGVQDIPYIAAQGSGVYVGTTLSVLNPNVIPTTWGNWWGEGDEKIYVDGESFPSTYGTGSEDYFNYSWSSPDIFWHPYCGQPRDDGPANRGFVVNQRWHVIDPLPFRTGLAFYMELASHERTEGVSYARMSYLYGRPGMTDDHVALVGEDLEIPQLPATWEPGSRFGSAGWEFEACEEMLTKKTQTTFREGPLWQGGRVLVWTPTKAGATLDLEFEVAEAGEYVLTLTCLQEPGAGSFSAFIDGETLLIHGKESVELSVAHGERSRMFGTNPLQLTAGTHTVTLTSVNADRPIGLDFFSSVHRKK